MLDRAQIEAILPHRDPFLFLDRVIELVPGEYAVAEKDLLPTEDVFRGHFPGHPVFPGVLQLEALAQTGAVAVLSQPGVTGQDHPVRPGRRSEVPPGSRSRRHAAVRDKDDAEQGSRGQGRGQGLRRVRARLQRRPHLHDHRAITHATSRAAPHHGGHPSLSPDSASTHRRRSSPTTISPSPSKRPTSGSGSGRASVRGAW